MLVASKPQIEHTMAKQGAIKKLQSLQKHGGEGGSNVHANADTVLCEFLDAVDYGEITREFRKNPRDISDGDPSILEAFLAVLGRFNNRLF